MDMESQSHILNIDNMDKLYFINYIDNKKFHDKCVPIIDKLIKDKSIRFIFTDNEIYIARYFDKIKFRKCTIYHTGIKPKHNIGKYELKGNYNTKSEMIVDMLNNSNHILNSDNN